MSFKYKYCDVHLCKFIYSLIIQWKEIKNDEYDEMTEAVNECKC